MNTQSRVPHSYDSLLAQLREKLQQAECFRRKRAAEGLN